MQVEGEALLVMLDMKGICASGGSACTSGAANASHVLRAIGLKEDEARGSLRLTPSWENTKEEMDVVVDHLKQIVAKLRRLTSALPSTE